MDDGEAKPTTATTNEKGDVDEMLEEGAIQNGRNRDSFVSMYGKGHTL